MDFEIGAMDALEGAKQSVESAIEHYNESQWNRDPGYVIRTVQEIDEAIKQLQQAKGIIKN